MLGQCHLRLVAAVGCMAYHPKTTENYQAANQERVAATRAVRWPQRK